jgi:transposase
MPPEMPPLPPEVAELLAAKDAQIAALTAQVQALLSRVEELERSQRRDSSNSGKPPSSDPIFDNNKPTVRDRSARTRGARSPGKQPGTESATLPLVDDPDETISCPPAECAGCGADLADTPVWGEQRRQVIEPSPVPPPTTREYRVQAKVCGCCGTTSVGQAPGCAAGRTQYGPEAHARAANLVVAHHVSIHRATVLLCQMSGLKVSAGWMATVRGKAAALLDGFLTHVTVLLRTAPALHVDETPARAGGKLRYVHVACTRYLTVMHTGDRSAEAIDAGGVLPGYDGIIVRDGYGGYAHLTDALHAWCGAHLLRDLKDLYDFEPAHQRWAEQMAAVLCQARDAAATARAAGATSLPDTVHTALIARYRALVTDGFTTNYYRRSATAKDAVRIARRFRDFEDLILRFLTRPDLDIFTNNEAERTIRPVKVQMRSSGGCWRTLQGLAEFALVHSYLSTAAKWGIDKLDALRRLFTTGPWLPPALAPPEAA